MAKVVNGGNKKGKVGSSIFYTIKNSNNKVTQGERIYQPNVTNPQSENQRAQRMKLKPATNFYAALSGILDHSFQGVKYGAMSRQYFLQQAIGKTQDVFPYLLKGENKFVPGPYLMSKGYLNSLPWSLDSSVIEIAGNWVGDDVDEDRIGAISRGLVSYSSFLQDGDQITLISVVEKTIDNVSQFEPIIGRFLIDTNSEASFSEVVPNYTYGGQNESCNFQPTSIGSQIKLVAACVILSRKNVSGGEVWQRSTERMVVSDRVYEMYMSPSAYADALESYKRTAASNDSDYYLNDAETPDEVGGGSSYSFTNQQAAFTLGTATQNITAVIAQNEFGGQATCAEFGFFADERPDGKTAWIKPYYILGRQLVAAAIVALTGPTEGDLTARFDGKPITVYDPRQFTARFTDITIG